MKWSLAVRMTKDISVKVFTAVKPRYKAEWQWFWGDCKKWLCHHLLILPSLKVKIQISGNWTWILSCKLPQLADIPLGKVLKLLQYRFPPSNKIQSKFVPKYLDWSLHRQHERWGYEISFDHKIQCEAMSQKMNLSEEGDANAITSAPKTSTTPKIWTPSILKCIEFTAFAQTAVDQD